MAIASTISVGIYVRIFKEAFALNHPLVIHFKFWPKHSQENVSASSLEIARVTRLKISQTFSFWNAFQNPLSVFLRKSRHFL